MHVQKNYMSCEYWDDAIADAGTESDSPRITMPPDQSACKSLESLKNKDLVRNENIIMNILQNHDLEVKSCWTNGVPSDLSDSRQSEEKFNAHQTSCRSRMSDDAQPLLLSKAAGLPLAKAELLCCKGKFPRLVKLENIDTFYADIVDRYATIAFSKSGSSSIDEAFNNWHPDQMMLHNTSPNHTTVVNKDLTDACTLRDPNSKRLLESIIDLMPILQKNKDFVEYCKRESNLTNEKFTPKTTVNKTTTGVSSTGHRTLGRTQTLLPG